MKRLRPRRFPPSAKRPSCSFRWAIWIDVAKETARLTKERDSVQRDIERGEAKLNNPGFMGKAPGSAR